MRYLSRALLVALMSATGAVQPVMAEQSDWQRFRANYPFHIQTIALGSNAPVGRTLILSEPPPSVTLAALQQRWPREFKDAVIQKHRVGVDGWVADIVTSLPTQSEDATRELVQQLTGYLFGTSYKSYVSPIDPDATGRRADLDVSVSTGQLTRWFGLERPTPGQIGRFLEPSLDSASSSALLPWYAREGSGGPTPGPRARRSFSSKATSTGRCPPKCALSNVIRRDGLSPWSRC